MGGRHVPVHLSTLIFQHAVGFLQRVVENHEEAPWGHDYMQRHGSIQWVTTSLLQTWSPKNWWSLVQKFIRLSYLWFISVRVAYHAQMTTSCSPKFCPFWWLILPLARHGHIKERHGTFSDPASRTRWTVFWGICEEKKKKYWALRPTCHGLLRHRLLCRLFVMFEKGLHAWAPIFVWLFRCFIRKC